MDEILNDRFLSVVSACNRCKHFDVFDYTCPAFPKGIPDELLEGKIKHDIPIPGQKGKKVFEQRI